MMCYISKSSNQIKSFKKSSARTRTIEEVSKVCKSVEGQCLHPSVSCITMLTAFSLISLHLARCEDWSILFGKWKRFLFVDPPGDFGGDAHRGPRYHSMQSFGGPFHSKIT